MANHDIPRTATRIETLFGIADDGNILVFKTYEHTRAGHPRPMYFVLQYLCDGRKLNRATRTTRQFTGHDARARLEAEMDEVRPMFTARALPARA
jgi:hypothetical protein